MTSIPGPGTTPARAPTDSAYIAALWEYPTLCFAIFGVQFTSADAMRLYDASGITEEIVASMQAAEGHLGTTPVLVEKGRLLLQYWSSSDALHAWSRIMPHTRWWKWLLDHAGEGIGFHHEIYSVSAAEAIYEVGAPPIGPATFCRLEAVRSGEGRSRERLKRFAEAHASATR